MLTRVATVGDAELIAEQRTRMFAESGQAEAGAMQEMKGNFVDWVRPRLADGSYVGWLVEDGGQVVAGAGLWWMEFPPHWMDAEPRRAYLLNYYVEPGMRGRGLAVQLLRTALEAAKARGVKVVTLHASVFGRPIYERAGFKATNEMILRLE